MWVTALSLAVWWVDGAHWPAVAILSPLYWHRHKFRGFCVIRTPASIGEWLSGLAIALFIANPYSFSENIYLKILIWSAHDLISLTFLPHPIFLYPPPLTCSGGRLIPTPMPRSIHIESVAKQNEQLVKKNIVVLAYLRGIGSTSLKDSKIHACSSLI